jgi:Kef-type K+ transport system membrane component KefB
MNTRGLVELIALNIGVQLKILSPRLFTMFIIMALATTFMTCPLLWLVYLRKYKSTPFDNNETNNNQEIVTDEKVPLLASTPSIEMQS